MITPATYSAVRRVQFCAGHRVHRHESKCRNLHGHNYVAYFYATAKAQQGQALDELGRVIDFGVLKQHIGQWLDAAWDHGFVLWDQDLEAIKAVTAVPDQKLYLLDTNPTAENMAMHLLSVVCPKVLADTSVNIHRVKLWETENCYVDVSI